MSYQAESFIQDLEKVARTRQEFAGYLAKMASTLETSEQLEDASGKLGLSPVITDLNAASQNLSSEVFRLLVLGDMKRGKSTFLNALMGENLVAHRCKPLHCCTYDSALRSPEASHGVL